MAWIFIIRYSVYTSYESVTFYMGKIKSWVNNYTKLLGIPLHKEDGGVYVFPHMDLQISSKGFITLVNAISKRQRKVDYSPTTTAI